MPNPPEEWWLDDALAKEMGLDIDAIEAGMDKCSTHLRGHDQALAINQPVPVPTELLADINVLENWIAQVRKRRN